MDLRSAGVLSHRVAISGKSFSRPLRELLRGWSLAEASAFALGLVRANADLSADAGALADEHGISVYDAAYVVAARVSGGELVSCDQRDLVSRGLARLPRDVLTTQLGT